MGKSNTERFPTVRRTASPTAANDKPKLDHFCIHFPKASCITGFNNDVELSALAFLKIGTPLANQPHWSCAQGVASRVIKRPEEERDNGYE
jgi:hypothetical protein